MAPEGLLITGADPKMARCQEGYSCLHCAYPTLADWPLLSIVHTRGPAAGAGGRICPAGLPPSPLLLCGLHRGPESLSAVSPQLLVGWPRWGGVGRGGCWAGCSGQGSHETLATGAAVIAAPAWPGHLFGPTVCLPIRCWTTPPIPCTSFGRMKPPGEGMSGGPTAKVSMGPGAGQAWFRSCCPTY